MKEHTFSCVNAIYRKATDKRHAGNPYIEALPPLPSDSQLLRALGVTPDFDPAERFLENQVRFERLNCLEQLLVPLPRLVQLASAIFKLLIAGYINRRPFTIADNRVMQDLYAEQMSGKFLASGRAELAAQFTMALIAASGMGKSFSLRHIASLLPPAIWHEAIGKWQLPFLFIEMPFDGVGAHSLASEMFEEFDRLLPDGNYHECFMVKTKTNAIERLRLALSIARDHGVGMIVVDEAQGTPPKPTESPDAAEPLPGSRTKRANRNIQGVQSETTLLKQLIRGSNVSHIPLLLSATPELKRRIGRFSLARRSAGRGSAQWGPLVPSERRALLAGLFRLQFVRKPVDLDDQWSAFFGEVTQDLPDIIVKLFAESQIYAIRSGAETLSQELVRTVLARSFITTEYGIQAIRSRDRTLLSVVTDLDLTDPLPPASGLQIPAVNASSARAPGAKGKRGSAPQSRLVPAPRPAQVAPGVPGEAPLGGPPPSTKNPLSSIPNCAVTQS